MAPNYAAQALLNIWCQFGVKLYRISFVQYLVLIWRQDLLDIWRQFGGRLCSQILLPKNPSLLQTQMASDLLSSFGHIWCQCGDNLVSNCLLGIKYKRRKVRTSSYTQQEYNDVPILREDTGGVCDWQRRLFILSVI